MYSFLDLKDKLFPALPAKMSNDNLVACPYNPKHIIKQTRMAYHLIKCKENHPGVNLVTCPFNATHRFPAEHERVRRIPIYKTNM